MILYLVKSTLCLTLLLLVYLLFLEKEKMHRFNRAYLLFSLAFSLVIPLIPVATTGILSGWELNQSMIAGDSVSEASGEGTVHAGGETAGSTASATPLKAIGFLYGLITLLLFIRFIWNINSILFKARRHKRIYYRDSIIVLLKEKSIPFSFFQYIFLSEKSYRDGRIKEEVLIHENTHVRQKHTLDILFIEILKVLFWFNPVFYYYKKAIQLNHEFLADLVVVSTTSQVLSYQSLLLDTSRPRPQYGLSSNFNYSMIKKRIMMMTRKRSRLRAIGKQLLILPVLGLSALLFGCEVTDHEPQWQERADDKVITIEITDSEIILVDGEEMPVSALDDHLSGLSGASDWVAYFRVQPEAYFGIVTDVQMILRKNDLLRINYSYRRTKTSAQNELTRVISQFKDAARRYMEMPVTEVSKDELKDSYDTVMNHINAIDEKQNEVYRDLSDQAPPLPPFPPNPEQRVRNEGADPDKADRE